MKKLTTFKAIKKKERKKKEKKCGFLWLVKGERKKS
jgi:hypothetical protein